MEGKDRFKVYILTKQLGRFPGVNHFKIFRLLGFLQFSRLRDFSLDFGTIPRIFFRFLLGHSFRFWDILRYFGTFLEFLQLRDGFFRVDYCLPRPLLRNFRRLSNDNDKNETFLVDSSLGLLRFDTKNKLITVDLVHKLITISNRPN